MNIRPAHDSDFAEVAALLHAVKLPVEGVPEHFGEFLVARDDAGELMGCVGQERYGDVTLLRSLAVNPAHQGNGLGRELTLELLAAARAYGMREVVLLTNTAAAFFQKHLVSRRLNARVMTRRSALQPSGRCHLAPPPSVWFCRWFERQAEPRRTMQYNLVPAHGTDSG